MKTEIQNKRLYFREYSKSEINWIKKTLTWEGKNSQIEECLLFKDGDDFFTLWGLHSILSKESNFKFEVTGLKQNIQSKIKVPTTILSPSPDGKFKELFSFQTACVEKALMLKRGICVIPTAGGKTEIELALFRSLISRGELKQGIVVVPSTLLAYQFKDRALLRGFSDNEIGILDKDNKDTTKPIVVSVINSLNRGIQTQRQSILNLISNANVMIYDECHHLRSSTWSYTALISKAEYVLGFTGTPFKEKNILQTSGDTLVYGITGGIIFTIPYSYLRKIGLIASVSVLFKVIPAPTLRYPGSFIPIYQRWIVNNDQRNIWILRYANKLARMGFSVLILVSRLEHGEFLMKNLYQEFSTICVFGGETSIQLNEFEQLERTPINYDWFRERFEVGEWQIAIVSPTGDEGLNLPSVGAVIMAGGMKSRIKITQRVGRGSRAKRVGPNRVYIVDFWDQAHVYLLSHSKKRLKLYEDIECEILDNEFVFINKVIEHAAIIKEEKNV